MDNAVKNDRRSSPKPLPPARPLSFEEALKLTQSKHAEIIQRLGNN